VLPCGPYDVGLARDPGSEFRRCFLQVVLWAYSGRRHFLDDPTFATLSVTDNVSARFPPVLITVGNVDPLRARPGLFVSKLRAIGAEPETLLFPDDHQPALNREYQFDLDTPDGQLFLRHVRGFLRQHLGDAQLR